MLVLVGDTPMSPEFHNIHQNIRNKTATTTKVIKKCSERHKPARWHFTT